MNIIKREREFFGRKLELSTGLFAKQAGGAVVVRYGDTMVLVTATAEKKPREGQDFFPLIVDYSEKMYAAGKIPGGYFKREGRPTEEEIIKGRLIDRSIRSLFPSAFKNDVQVVVSVLSVDGENPPDILAIIGASAALSISSIPFYKTIGAVRVGRVNNKFILNPTTFEMDSGDLDLVVSATDEQVVMIEAGAKEVSEDVILEGIKLAKDSVKPIIDMIEELVEEIKPIKMEIPVEVFDPELELKCQKFIESRFEDGSLISTDKLQREDAVDLLLEEAEEEISDESSSNSTQVKELVKQLFKKQFRNYYISKNIRIDGRKLDEIREINTQVGILPRVHGSGLFSRGQTQVMVVTTLGAFQDVQYIDGLGMDEFKRFMYHYNFYPYSVGEAKPLRGPGRREIGHGSLAARALTPVLPDEDEFPYTIRLVSEVLESNGSTSMASVCSGCLSLMDAGVPIKKPVAGISIGLIKEGEKHVLLTDIQGIEDALGDMDFKVAGTSGGITAIQLDIKTMGIDEEIIKQALIRAKDARLFILDKMSQTISKPRSELSLFAPHVVSFDIDPDKIGELIGPGGKVIRKISKETGAQIDIQDSIGKVYITAPSKKSLEKAYSYVETILRGVKIGGLYEGKVTKIANFGVFVEIAPNKEGLLHTSQMEVSNNHRAPSYKVGETLKVKVQNIDQLGRINLTQKGL